MPINKLNIPTNNDIINIKQQSLYARLKRLFSNDVIVRNQGGKQIKVKDTDNVMIAMDKNSLHDRFNRIRSTNANAYTRDFSLSYQAARMDLFRDYDVMDYDPIISSILDIYADECLTNNEMGNILTVHSNNSNVKKILENLFYDILNVKFTLWSWTRNLCKYGDFYLKLYITPEYGIYTVDPISAYNVERIENSDPYNKRYVKFQIRPTDTSKAEVLENYEMIHFRLIGDSNFSPYGKSLIEGGRRIWKQLSLLEDAMLIHRIMRAPEKRIFYTDIAGIAPNEIDAFMQKMMDKMKKTPYLDENTGEYNLRFNLQNMVEDYFIPVRGGDSGTKIDTLQGMQWTGIDDVEYLKNKMLAAFKVPKAFIGFEDVAGKSTLASEDVRFARTIQRIQSVLVSELSKIAIIHLYSQGYRDESLVDFELELTNPSTIFEKEKIEIWSDKISVATDMVENKFFSRTWVYKNIFHMSDDDISQVQDEIVEDVKENYRFTSMEEDGTDPKNPIASIKGGSKEGGDGGGLGGDIGMGGGKKSGMGGEIEDIGKELEKGGGGGGGGEESPLKETLSEPRDQSDRDQTGEKKIPRMGEDPLGALGRHETPKSKSEGQRKSAIRHNFEGGTPLKLEEKQIFLESNKGLLNSLSSYLSKSLKETKQELLDENIDNNTNTPNSKLSMLDEKNILNDLDK